MTKENVNVMKASSLQISRLGYRVIIQAAKDFAFPKNIERVKEKIKRLDKNNVMYAIDKQRIYNVERRKIIKELKGSFVSLLTEGRSEEVARKLEEIMADKSGHLMKQLRRHVKNINMED